MISSKVLKILLLISGLLGFILVASVIQRRTTHPAKPFAGAIEAADRITLEISSRTVELTRGGGIWSVTVSTAGPFKAEGDKVKALITGLKDLQLDDVISEQGNRASDFELNPESATAVMLFGKNQAILTGGHFGKQAADFNHIYFRPKDKPAVYLAHGVLRTQLGDGEINSWRDRTVLNLPEDQVLTLLITGPGFKTTLARTSDTWSLDGRVIDPAPVWGTLGVLAHLRADDFIDAPQSEQTAAKLTFASATLQMKDGSTHTVHIGRQNTVTKRYPVAVDQNPAVFWVAENAVKGILRKPAEFKPK